MVFEIAIPDTALTTCSDLREKTVVSGQIGRALSIYRVETVVIYSTGSLKPKQRRDVELLAKILTYMDTPQYLRKRVFPRTRSLKYVGVLPPLRTRSHPLSATTDSLKVGDTRWGIQVEKGKVDLGLDKFLSHTKQVSERKPTLFRVVDTRPDIQLEVVPREAVDEYWGYEVQIPNDLLDYLKAQKNTTRVVLSRNAPPFSHLRDDLQSTVANTRRLTAVFGGPRSGVTELFEKRRDQLKERVDFWMNTIPEQGTETVRLEEAIMASLAVLNDSIGHLISRKGFYN